ncbi:hypothetical protein [Methanobrevibacter boviskoreani]|jgi:ribosomal protein S27AE|uniref:hypothetical protein n=1 Tax=Methanobrevibacter boviskoreani TaxID=1348249 RepID=UPI000592CACB|nr:hypothetical protein [Methanobrevibacter boviskoreani]MCI6774750.1 hypothetical protein [Methanobrevibacter boviskoreani]MCI6930571.1 hypothetical protein [Methanobrevibacter boviskoreani]MDY5614706.1 hypothetical protein [Methanobrevibacter boviskoreani]
MKKKICPRCGSRKVKWIIPQVWSRWICYNCDYTGPVIEVDDDLEREIVNNWRENKEEIMKEAELNRLKMLNHEKDEEDNEEDDLTDEEIDKKLEDLGI